MQNRGSFLFLICALLFPLAVSAQTSKDVRQIYRLVSDSAFGKPQKSESPDYVLNETRDDLETKANSRPISLIPFLTHPNIVLITNKEFDELRTRSTAEWKARMDARPPSQRRVIEICGSHDMELFEKKYPKAVGINYLSRIRFDSKRSRATISVYQYSGCGGGSQDFSLRKKKGKWKITTVSGSEWVA